MLLYLSPSVRLLNYLNENGCLRCAELVRMWIDIWRQFFFSLSLFCHLKVPASKPQFLLSTCHQSSHYLELSKPAWSPLYGGERGQCKSKRRAWTLSLSFRKKGVHAAGGQSTATLAHWAPAGCIASRQPLYWSQMRSLWRFLLRKNKWFHIRQPH